MMRGAGWQLSHQSPYDSTRADSLESRVTHGGMAGIKWYQNVTIAKIV
jgi:hypothetical protein